MKFIQVTPNHSPQKHWINIYHIVRVKPNMAGSWIDLVDKKLHVECIESPDTIITMIKAAYNS